MSDASTAAAPAASAAAPEAKSGGMSTAMFSFVLIWPLVVAGLSIAYLDKKGDERMQALIDKRPDVAVVDDIALIKLAIDNGADRYNPGSIMTEIGKIVDKHELENTILLSQSMIMYAPPANRIRVNPGPVQSEPAREIGK